jgi:hypothetical protein
MVTGPMMLMASVMGRGSETCFEYDEERHRPQSRGDQHLILLLDSLDKLTYLQQHVIKLASFDWCTKVLAALLKLTIFNFKNPNLL